MVETQSAIVKMVWANYGELPCDSRGTDGALRAIASRHHWRRDELLEDPMSSFRTLIYYDHFPHRAATLLVRDNMVALVHPNDTPALMTGRRYLSGGVLWDALSGAGRFIMLEPEWLSADLTPEERRALLTSPDPGEAYSVKYWKPRTRGDVIFNGWD